ncbi:hypothetical protein BpHYR1_053367 [Brachionus plicatilis]|uniref:Uncharacterized protein n=1 Tax=Brachionus plicatilis TaxID=10195 RepID=A0A3M7S7W4_BRAPC|nr:hypothetical protein BpHYR1_053367 [Brachionus plicatilis]
MEQSDECVIRKKIDNFKERKYEFNEEPLYPDYVVTDNRCYGCIKKEIEITDDKVNGIGSYSSRRPIGDDELRHSTC